MASPPSNRLQHMLQAAVQGVQWTYSLFWQLCPQQGILVWGDGYYNGAIKTRKTVQPMEVSTEEASLQRSQQLRELYDSLSAGETNQPARRPCAALSPEDLTESEWFYLMCVSFSFPPGVGLPGKAYSRRHHVWLTGANEADSKLFSRAILAKTVVCIPLMDGVLELGTTERVQEDLGLIQHAKSFFTDHQNQQQLPKPALSEQSTSNPTSSSDRPCLHSPPLPTMFAIANPQPKQDEPNQEEEDDDDDDDDDEADSDSEAEIGRTHMNFGINPVHMCGQIPHVMSTTQIIAEPSELMQLEMSEDIRIGSPDDCSNNIDSEPHVLAASHSVGQADQPCLIDSYRAESARAWPSLPDELNNTLPPSGSPQIHDLPQEDTHYSQTVSAILQLNCGRWTNSSSNGYFDYSQQSAFSKWSGKNNHLLCLPLEGTSQWRLKYILFTVPFLHNKYRDENSPKSRDGDNGSRFRKSTPQDELSANHVLAERRRREKLNERFIILRSLVPFVTKMDKASILGDTIEYVKQLRKRIQDLESRNRSNESNQRLKEMELQKLNNSKEQSILINTNLTKSNASQNSSGDRSRSPIMEKRKMRVVEGTGSAKTKAVDATFNNTVQVSIIERDALLEFQCPYRDGLLLEIMQTLSELRLEITAVQSSSTNGIFITEIRAKVKDRINGKKASIMEVKKAIHQIIPHY
ncbi:transcription factor BHLH42 isoform X2 [Magnolia sinica]|uniref:transcription factor BHLH42 isoform X2 n=1 Tax=Magnolia sinica TaxID=86752 RepID=UPI00265A8FBB|nr:transcription factor BHLH42 isoform X2 [Magnolia sinica]